jgi:hypothetical protein
MREDTLANRGGAEVLTLVIISAAGTVMGGAAAVVTALAGPGILRRRPRSDEDLATGSETAESTKKSDA